MNSQEMRTVMMFQDFKVMRTFTILLKYFIFLLLSYSPYKTNLDSNVSIRQDLEQKWLVWILTSRIDITLDSTRISGFTRKKACKTLPFS